MNPKSKSKMIKALRKWGYVEHTDGFIGVILKPLNSKPKLEITKLFNEAITKRNEK